MTKGIYDLHGEELLKQGVPGELAEGRGPGAGGKGAGGRGQGAGRPALAHGRWQQQGGAREPKKPWGAARPRAIS